MPVWTHFGERLRELRQEAGLSQSELAEHANLPLPTIQGYEQGRREPIWNVVFQLARVLGVEVDRFAEIGLGYEYFFWRTNEMKPTFIRIFDMSKDKEILLNVNAISEIQVEYVVLGKGPQKKVGFSVGLGEARKNPDAMRIYHIFVGATRHTLAANPGSPVMQVLDDIYKNAVKNED
ncbi:MAG: XRE family transcriptional regulator [Gemmataceae bacterium]|nr:XRE family transcriptional regulator [Gemmataceae bacterium]